ncbi:hypothetical protein EV360DRAFT_85641 [Lentinula raphanica]|nr:hypothetical protein EV360DRAFT_85641 [Lentinula raphanica]
MTRRSSRVSQKKVSTVDPASQTQPSYETTASRVIAQQPLTSRPVRSTRRRVVKTQDKDASEDANEDEYKDGGGQSSSKRRKRKNTKMPDEFRKVRGRRGLLEGLTKDVPLDIIYEIFSYLETSDLLTLARTTRDLRSTLMSKTSEFMWRTARLNLDDLPPLPKDLSEPQYADLLFGTHCYAVYPHSGLFVHGAADLVLSKRECHEHIHFVPRIQSRGNRYPYLQSLRRAQPQDYRDANILPREVIPGIFREHSKSTPARHVGHTALTMRLRDEYDSLTDEEEITAWVTRKWEEEEAIRTHGQLCHKWYSDMLQKREDRLLEERKDAILRNLEDWGLREEAEIIINSPNPRLFLKHEGVDEPKKLTTHAWNQMKEELVELLSDHRERRIAEIVKAAALERYEKLHKSYNEIVTNVDFREPFPLAEDVLDDQVCEELVWNTPPEIDLTSDFLSLQIAQFMPSFIQRWKSAKVLELVNKIKEVVPTFAMSDLQLATTIFRCGRCSRKMHFPEMFYHRCCREPLSSNHSRMKIFTEKSPLFQRKAPWNSSFIHLYNGPSMIVVQDVIKACGLEPETASIHDLYAAHPLIECLHCARYNGDRHFMRFHDLLGHFTGSSTYTVTINSFGDETEDILRCERFCLDQFRCAHCHAEIGNRAIDVSKHLEERHPEMLLMFDEKPHRFDTAQESPPEPTLKSLQDHWYWNTRRNFKSFYESRLDSTFRYRKATTGSS